MLKQDEKHNLVGQTGGRFVNSSGRMVLLAAQDMCGLAAGRVWQELRFCRFARAETWNFARP